MLRPVVRWPVLLHPRPIEHHIELLGPMLGASVAVAERTPVRLRYRHLNAFLSAYLSRLRRGGSLLVEAPRYTFVGDLLDLDVRIDGYRPLLLFAQVIALRLSQVEVRVVCGPSTDDLVRPLAVRALGVRHAAGLLTARAR